MAFWAKSLVIFNCFYRDAKQSIRDVARQTGFSKSSVHRLKQALLRRGQRPESWFWETDEGHQWLRRLVVATLYCFGLKRGVGADTMSEFFTRLDLYTRVGSSPSAIRTLLQELERTVIDTAQSWEQQGVESGQGREVIGAVDETFFEKMMLVFIDLPTGYILLEDAAEDRSYATWSTRVQARLEALQTSAHYLVSDRAKALIQLAQQGLECRSVPDLFHLLHDLSKAYSFAIARPLRQARREVVKAEVAARRYEGFDKRRGAAGGAHRHLRAMQALVRKWEGIQSAYRGHLEAWSLTVPPFAIGDSTPQSTSDVAHRLETEVEAFEAFVQHHQLPSKPEVIKKVRNQIPDLAALIDYWWQGVARDLAPLVLTPPWRRWVKEALLPWAYWQCQMDRTRRAGRKAKMRETVKQVKERFEQHPITHRLPANVLADWSAWATEQTKAHCTGQKVRIGDKVDKYDVLAPSTHSRVA